MKTQFLLSCFLLTALSGFSQFSEKNYINFRESVKDLTFDDLNRLNQNNNVKYYKGFSQTPDPAKILYLDSVKQKLNLTAGEVDLLMQNHFVVTERLNQRSFGDLYQYNIFNKDLPVFISTDLILHALHTSYDNILKSTEITLMLPNLKTYLEGLYNKLPEYAEKYGGDYATNIADVDLYLSVAYSLITDSSLKPRYANQENYNQLLKAIKSEELAPVQLFTDDSRSRRIDFSQFKVRGHYVFTEEDKWMGNTNLEPYFKTMMWLGRIDFPLTSPPTGDMEPPWRPDEIKRINISAFILNEMMQLPEFKKLLDQNDEIINYLVGDSDNFTADEYTSYLQSKGIYSATQLQDSMAYKDYFEGLSTNPDYLQQYMGAFYFVDPTGEKPDALPVSFLVSGQRFIVDAYVLANVVFDRIIFNGNKIYRMMPDPLDALYALGNNNALYFLEDELTKFPYGTQLALMRYLIDNKEPEFWSENLYNTWLKSIRALNPIEDNTSLPFFMRTGAWNQQKMNTQLAAWTQLRHDNLLYAKPSYTGGVGCSFPYSYVEPYPAFYKALADYANQAADFFSTKNVTSEFSIPIDVYFRKFAGIVGKLETLAQKELDNIAFTTDEENWLKQFLIQVPHQECGGRPFNGWILDLYWRTDKLTDPDFLTVDIHTQPTDENGIMVGRVLHAGTGFINLGVVLAEIPGSDITVAYSGAFTSYYEYITNNFLRVNDQEWEEKVYNGNIPARPEWTAAYLAGKNGETSTSEKSLPTTMLIIENANDFNSANELAKIYPNPVSDLLTIRLKNSSLNQVDFSVFDMFGRQLKAGQITGDFENISFSEFASGMYMIKLKADERVQSVKILKK